jgi:hypothetical protein
MLNLLICALRFSVSVSTGESTIDQVGVELRLPVGGIIAEERSN